MSSSPRRPRPRLQLPLWGVGILVVLIAVFLLTSTVWLFQTVQGMAASWEVTGSGFDPGTGNEVNAEGIRAPGDPLITSLTPEAEGETILSADTFQPWSGQERVTILLLGIDLRCGEEGPTHTDSMMVLTIDPVGMSGAVLSLPRDMWVEIPGFGVDRINQAYYNGEIYDYPGGGAALAMETVEATLGVPINYYAAVNFQGFIDFVDLIGGITVDISEDISDPDYPDGCYGYDPFYVTAGEHQLDGARALKYARTRATIGGDVDRAGRQQEVVMAVREKVLRVNMVPRLLVQAPQLWQAFQQNVRTDISLEEAIQLGLLGLDIPRESIRTAVIDYNYVYNETTPDGRQVLVPRRENIRKLRDELFAPPAIPTPVVENLPQMMREENARVVVHNGTAVFGLASDTQEYLRRYHVNVVDVGNADSAAFPSTQILDFGNHPNTTHYLARLLEVPPLNVSYSADPPEEDGDYDVLIILGNDWQIPGSEEE